MSRDWEPRSALLHMLPLLVAAGVEGCLTVEFPHSARHGTLLKAVETPAAPPDFGGFVHAVLITNNNC